ncbi:SAM-dependent methyltransferase [Alicyclobacillus sp.]|uniref:SAM-dependent methyltransferase n=1 Tax=Alicyclobacillus sp. TaxID=61169 RepID=UPI0025C6138A|nr:SAM-dependent methyltransferase [Alicyclobacillus sp.]MCL6515353.1 SAM-dependent methyltransferase [Alicyclobacillus sp.]
MTRSSHHAPDEPSVCRLLRRGAVLSFGAYMAMALYGEGGYYTQSVRIAGADGDFYTASRFSLFARTMARVALRVWSDFGRPADWQVVEWGPGQGELARGIAKALDETLPPGVRVRYVLMEVSPRLADQQRMTLGDSVGRVSFHWGHPDPALPSFVIGNEVLDALPVERVRRTRGGWEQAVVRWGEAGPVLEWRAAEPDIASLADRFLPLSPGAAGEVCPGMDDFFKQVAASGRPLRGVFVDYGIRARDLAEGLRPEGTVRGYRAHRVVDPLGAPGRCDITADVHWDAAMRAAEAAGLSVVRLTDQGAFLLEQGILEVLQAETPAVDEPGRQRLVGQFKQLVLPGGMGERFQVLEVQSASEK